MILRSLSLLDSKSPVTVRVPSSLTDFSFPNPQPFTAISVASVNAYPGLGVKLKCALYVHG